jgi:hypothetical protein
MAPITIKLLKKLVISFVNTPPEPNVIKLFTAVIFEFLYYAREFVPGRLF